MPDDIWLPFYRALCDDGIDATAALKIVADHPRCVAGIIQSLAREYVDDVAEPAVEMAASYPMSLDVSKGIAVMMVWVAAKRSAL